MALIQGFRGQSYRALKDITLGKPWNKQGTPALTPRVSVIGKYGVGKSTLLDALGFLSDCLAVGMEEACGLKQRGGFDRPRSSGATGPMLLVLSRASRLARTRLVAAFRIPHSGCGLPPTAIHWWPNSGLEEKKEG